MEGWSRTSFNSWRCYQFSFPPWPLVLCSCQQGSRFRFNRLKNSKTLLPAFVWWIKIIARFHIFQEENKISLSPKIPCACMSCYSVLLPSSNYEKLANSQTGAMAQSMSIPLFSVSLPANSSPSQKKISCKIFPSLHLIVCLYRARATAHTHREKS